jgi:curved DNA-binding protein CbpA
MRDHYVVLGVAVDADSDSIRGAYRRLAARYHPDRNTDPDASSHFREVQEAYEVLGNPVARESYDQLRQRRLLDDPLRVARELWQAHVRIVVGN